MSIQVASTNYLDRLDPGLSKRPSRFDRKYLFPLPNEVERVLYCNYWREKLKYKPSIRFPKKLCIAIAGITQDFSFAYLKEAFVATLLTIARRRTEDAVRGGGDDEDDDLDDYELWVEMKKTVKALREDMGTRSKRTAFGHMLEAATPQPMSFPTNPILQQGLGGSAALPIQPDLPFRVHGQGQTASPVGHLDQHARTCDPWSAIPLINDQGEVLDQSADILDVVKERV